MESIVNGIEAVFAAIPLPLLEVWGRFGYLLGFILMLCAFGGFTFRPAGRWGAGRERQAWDAQALRSLVLTFVLVLATGYLGSFIVLVPGAQTFESLKDLTVFLCIVLFGYPALVMVPFAYGLSDLIEGVPPAFLLDWLPGYFINPACFWLAYQLIGKDPDFRQWRTWRRYLLFVVAFMSLEPQLWGYICADKFTPEISYRNITPALFFTTAITWLIAPVAMLAALPLARKFGMYWAEIPGHVRERALGRKEWIWEAGAAGGRAAESGVPDGLPIRMFLVTPFIVLVLVMVGSTAYVTLRSAEKSADKLATQLHRESSENINLYLDAYLERSQNVDRSRRAEDIAHLLSHVPIAGHGKAFIVDRAGRQIASSGNSARTVSFANAYGNDLVAQIAVDTLAQKIGGLGSLRSAVQLRFDVVTAKPLARETWLLQATPYRDRSGSADWIVMTAMPAAYYQEGVRTGNSRSAMVFAVALTLSLVVAAYLALLVTESICRISHATQELMKGHLTQRVPDSRLMELGALSRSFNSMAGQLQRTIDDLRDEVEVRKRRERELEESQVRVRLSENRLQLATRAAHLGVWDWDVVNNELVWDDAMYQQYGIAKDEFGGAYEAWSKCLAPEDFARATADVEVALRGEREFASEFGVRWPDGSVHYIKGIAQTLRDEDGRPLRMVGVNYDITEQKRAAEEIMKLNRDQQRALQRLQESEERYRTLFTNMTEGFVLGEPIFDEQGRPVDIRLLEVNDAFYLQTSIPKGILGRPVREYLPQLEQFWIDRYAAVARTGQGERFESYNADTQRHYEVYTFCPTPGRFAALFLDVSVRKQTEEALLDSEQRYRALFNNRTNAIAHMRIVTDEGGKPVNYCTEAVNEAYERIVGINKEEIVGKLITEVFPDIRQLGFDFIGEFGAIALEGGEGEFEMYFPPTRQWFSLYAYSPKHGECTAIFTDISEQKRAAEEVMKLNAELERRVAERTAQLEAANKELEAFSYSVSHDLKAPLRGIDGYSQLLEETAAERLDEEGRLFVRNIREGAAQMQALIADLLGYARMERRRLGDDVLELPACVDAVMQGYVHDIAKRGIVLTSAVPALAVRADREGLAIVLRNLIDNALKFSRDARPPTVEIGARDDGGKVVIWVRDNGIGFDMQFHDRIFEIFSRLQRAEDYSGTGVGLALVRKAMQRMGGRVWAESAPGQGATFFLELKHG